MKKIITAIGNPILNRYLKRNPLFEILSEDIQYQEGILEFLEKQNQVDFLILSELLPGEFEIKEFINKIKQTNYNLQIILFLEKKNQELENYLYAKGIYNIFYHNEVELEDLVEIIKNGQKNPNQEIKKELDELKKLLLEKEQKEQENSFIQINPKKNKIKKCKKEKNSKDNKNIDNNQPKQIICISGTNGVGKSVVTVNLAKVLENKNNKILIIDFDVFYNSLHTILGIKKYPDKIKNKIRKNDLLQEINVEELIIKINHKIDLIAGINLLFDAKYQISSMKIKSILTKLKESYDTIIIDTTSECFFDYTKEIMKQCNFHIFIVEANLLEIKKAKKLLNIYINEWKIPQKGFHILFNKYNSNSIDSSILKNIFSGFSIIGKLSLNSKYNLMINRNISINISKKIQKEYEKIKQNIIKSYKSFKMLN